MTRRSSRSSSSKNETIIATTTNANANANANANDGTSDPHPSSSSIAIDASSKEMDTVSITHSSHDENGDQSHSPMSDNDDGRVCNHDSSPEHADGRNLEGEESQSNENNRNDRNINAKDDIRAQRDDSTICPVGGEGIGNCLDADNDGAGNGSGAASDKVLDRDVPIPVSQTQDVDESSEDDDEGTDDVGKCSGNVAGGDSKGGTPDTNSKNIISQSDDKASGDDSDSASQSPASSDEGNSSSCTSPNDIDASPSASDSNSSGTPDSDAEEQWDIVHVFSLSEMYPTNPDCDRSSVQMCSTKNCPLVACVTYLSNLDVERTEPWHSCLDCQENDFGGWPEKMSEIPLKEMGKDHRNAIVELCTAQYAPKIPDFPLPASEKKMEEVEMENNAKDEAKSVLDDNSDGNRAKDTVNGTSKGDGLKMSSPNPKINGDNDVTNVTASTSTPVQNDNKSKGSTSAKDELVSPTASPASACASSSNGSTDEEEPEEQWNIVHVFSTSELKQTDLDKVQTCCTKKCPLLACVTYLSNLDKDKSQPWHSCIDCQEKDFGGWPEKNSEIPLKVMSTEHRNAIVEACTAQYAPVMPKLPTGEEGQEMNKHQTSGNGATKDTSIVPQEELTTSGSQTTAAVTPLPPKNGKIKKKTKKATGSAISGMASLVSPLPSASSKKGKSGNGMIDKTPKGVNKEMYRKWQATADKLGGGRVIVKKSDAKPLIFECLSDAFRPMNITELHGKLKGVVPSMVLQMCLGDMVNDHFSAESQFVDSDDEEENKKKSKKKKVDAANTSGDYYTGSITCKSGRNTNTTLYYVDYSKTSNDGNGLLPDAKNELLCNSQKAKADLVAIDLDLKAMGTETVKLLSEPTNEDAATSHEMSEKEVNALREEVESCSGLKGNEKLTKKLKKRIETMSAHWRSRKKKCKDFLIMMEEATDGTVSLKKSMSGDGQIELDSDESVIKGAKDYYEMLKNRNSSLGKRSRTGNSLGSKKKQKSNHTTVVADANFIGVAMTNAGIKRIFLSDDGE